MMSAMGETEDLARVWARRAEWMPDLNVNLFKLRAVLKQYGWSHDEANNGHTHAAPPTEALANFRIISDDMFGAQLACDSCTTSVAVENMMLSEAFDKADEHYNDRNEVPLSVRARRLSERFYRNRFQETFRIVCTHCDWTSSNVEDMSFQEMAKMGYEHWIEKLRFTDYAGLGINDEDGSW